MGFAKPIEQIFIKLSRYIYVSKRYYTRRNSNENNVHFILAKGRSCGIMNKPRRSSKLNEHLMKETKRL